MQFDADRMAGNDSLTDCKIEQMKILAVSSVYL